MFSSSDESGQEEVAAGRGVRGMDWGMDELGCWRVWERVIRGVGVDGCRRGGMLGRCGAMRVCIRIEGNPVRISKVNHSGSRQ
jgi:hypothetical protein